VEPNRFEPTCLATKGSRYVGVLAGWFI